MISKPQKMNLIKLFRLCFIFACLLTTGTTLSQIDECGFQITAEQQRYYDSIKDQVKELEQEFLNQQLLNRNSTLLSSVPVKAHIVRTTSGAGGLTATQLDDAMAIMNSIYVNAGIEFFLCDGINYINSDDWFNYETTEEGAMTGANNVAGVINIYFTNSIVNSNGGGLCGYAYFPGGPETILMANSCATNGSTLSHEMGHFFALSHTHGNSNVIGSTEELVDGSNCDTTGDGICDTPADPQLGNFNVNGACQYYGFAQDANFELYQPDPLNLMSYSRKECRTVFSPQQYARINAIYQLARSSMSCPSFSADFVADETESCEASLTVNFTDNSVGATGWSWDVDGDDIIDYTTQNVTHTYNTAGEYDVALTITNGSTDINKVKTEYIDVGAQEINTATIELTLVLDDWPAETTWEFLDGNGNVIASEGPYIEGIDDFTTKTATFTINPNLCYAFRINDSYGDGICCFSGNGYYELRGDDNSLLATDGDFQFGTTNNFYSGILNVDSFSTEPIALYPNPSSSFITVKAQSLPDSYIIYNTLGQVLKQSEVDTENDLNVNIESLNDGLYFIKLTRATSSQVLSFVKN